MKNNKAFTLVELLVVISIIGVISSIVFVSFSGSRDKAKLAKAQNFDAQVSHALGAYAVGIWRFENGSVLDESGCGNDGTIHGATFVPNGGVYEGTGALNFDGNGYVEMGANSPSLSEIAGNKLTLEAWVKPETLSGTQYIIQKNGPFFLNLSGKKLQGRIYPPWTRVTGDISLSLKKWNHCVLVYDGINMSLYVNGKFDKSIPKTGNLAGNGCVQIGQYTGGGCGAGSSRFHGLIDNVSIYNEALSSAQIQQHFVASAPAHGIAVK